VKIEHRFRPLSGNAARVTLLGEASDWISELALTPLGDGSFAATRELPVGVYQYKLRADDAWTLDGANARTRNDGGSRNNVLVVGGAPEPLLFAAAPPWVEELANGGVRVLAGVRRPGSEAAAAPALSYSEDGATWSEGAFAPAFEEVEHAFFVATLPVSAPHVRLRLDAFETSWTRPPASERLPAWWRDAAVYAVFVDRFRPASDRGAGERPWEHDPGKERVAGGHLDGVRRSLDELAKLGVNTLYLTPVHVGASVHRYDLVDPLTVDPQLGGEAAYDALIAAARGRGMRIVQDVSIAHAGRGFPAYEDVLAHGASSRWAPWFVWKDGALVHYGKRTDAPLLDLGHGEVADLVLRSVTYWARRGASGLRLDMTAEIPLGLGRRIRNRFRELVPDGIVFGEVVPQHAWRWRQEHVVDAATDFAFREALVALTCTPHASVGTAIAAMLRDDLVRGGDARTTAVRLLSSHDHPRLATLAAASGTLARLPLAYALLATWPGVPMLLYGEELGMRSDGATRDAEDVWPDRAPRPWAAGHGDGALRAAVNALFRARAGSKALRHGTLEVLFTDDTTLVFRRESGGEVVDVALSFADTPKRIALEDDERPRLVPLTGTGRVEGAVVDLPPFGMLVAAREHPLGRAIAPVRARRNLVLRDRELEGGRTAIEARPSRFFFSVTERCNLRCEHCITHAPDLTASGAARTMTPAVLDALRDDLGFADYVAFVHGGESLTTPVLFDVLGALRDARGAEPWVAHLLTNGILLSVRVAARLVAAGVSSIAVSLDGASSRTNDAIRSGGTLARVRANLEDIVAWRRGEGIDLRLGLSFVILRQNVHELCAFVDLAAELGLDWVKLEEGVPATAFARRSLVSCDSRAVREQVERAMVRGRGRGLVMVDHTRDRAVWRCRLDDETRVFLAADEHANRSTIHPCRTPWETVCVEPNGDVRVQDFFGPVLGNVTMTPLRELWNARPAVEGRERSLAARLCGTGPVTCLR